MAVQEIVFPQVYKINIQYSTSIHRTIYKIHTIHTARDLRRLRLLWLAEVDVHYELKMSSMRRNSLFLFKSTICIEILSYYYLSVQYVIN